MFNNNSLHDFLRLTLRHLKHCVIARPSAKKGMVVFHLKFIPLSPVTSKKQGGCVATAAPIGVDHPALEIGRRAGQIFTCLTLVGDVARFCRGAILGNPKGRGKALPEARGHITRRPAAASSEQKREGYTPSQ
jgi:hypothetical protein